MAHFNQHLQALDTILYQIRYRDPQRIRGEVADLFMKPHVASLTPQSRPLTRNGPPQQLLCLVGTIPIVYNGASYNIPINLWIVDQYPWNPPVVYVTPTNDMAITPRHKHVDLSGMVYHPYMSSWNMATSNLAGLITSLSSVFSAEPPVRSQAPARSPTASPSLTSSNYTPQPQPQPQQPQQAYPPQYPHQQPSPYTQPPPPSPYGQPPAYPNQYPSQQPNGTPRNVGTPPSYQQSNPPPAYQHPPEYTPPKPEDPEVVEKRNALAKATEKVSNEVKKFHAQISPEIDKLTREKYDGEEVGAHFAAEKVRLQQEIDHIEQETKLLTDKLEELTKWLELNDTNTEPDIDTVTDPKDPLAKQLLSLVAQDHTIQDTCFYLDKALANDKISLDAFLKTIRSISREQFQVRALMRKVENLQRQQLIQQQQQHIHQHPPPPNLSAYPTNLPSQFNSFTLGAQRA
eukprot:Phypoly_transcript_05342.p1 GENE.Phypoly_transcript_05342~~Phypoly_transcript_05342.p1  ORF type:complete len:459 (+),score=101.56 Phypoly_transcript_05342:98-1474(+)